MIYFWFQLLEEELYIIQLSYLHNDLYICDMIYGAQRLKSRADSTGIQRRNESIEDLTSADMGIEASSSSGVNNARMELKRNNLQWFKPQPNNLYERNKSVRLLIFVRVIIRINVAVVCLTVLVTAFKEWSYSCFNTIWCLEKIRKNCKHCCCWTCSLPYG